MTRSDVPSPARAALRSLAPALAGALACPAGAFLLVAVLARQVVERGRYPVFDEAPLVFLAEWGLAGARVAWPAAGTIFVAVFLVGLAISRLSSPHRRRRARGALWIVSIVGALSVVGFASDRLRHEAEASEVEPGALPPPVPFDEPAPAPGPSRTAVDLPDVLLVTIDTLRAGHLGYEGYDRPTSPNIDRLAGRGVAFEAAIAQAPATDLSVASLLTGLHSHVVDDARRRDGRVALADGFHSLAERLRATGYRTAAFVSNPNLKRGNGFAQGFDHFDQDSGMFGDTAYRRSMDAEQVADAAIEWLDETPAADTANDGRPVFLWLHLLDPHHPYEPDEPGPWEDTDSETFRRFESEYRSWTIPTMTRHLRALAADPSELRPGEIEYLVGRYDAEILQADRHLGRFFDAWGRARGLDDALVVLTSDHGEEFHEHGGFLHGHSLVDELIHVPLVIAGPGFDSGRDVETQVSLLDLAPTVLRAADLLDEDARMRLAGEPLQDLVNRPAHHRPALAQRAPRALAFRTGEHKLVGPKQIVEPGCPATGPHTEPWSDLRRLYRARYLPESRWPEQRIEVEVYDLAADPGETTLETDPLEIHRVLCAYADLLRREPPRPPAGEETQRGLSEEDKESLRALGYVVD